MKIDFDHQVLAHNAFGVIDPLMEGQIPEGVVTELLVPQDLTASAHLMPRLVDLREMPSKPQDTLLECLYRSHKYDEQPLISLFIKTEANAKDFSAHWNGMQLATPYPNRKFWLRLHDPRVLHQLLRIATPPQRRKLFGRATAFTYWIDGEWTTAQVEGGNLSGSAIPLPGSALPFSGATAWDWARIERIGMVNRALSGAGINKAAALASHGALAEQLFERAYHHHGLADTGDIVEFAVRGLTMRNRFDEHPEIARAILPRNSPDDDSSLADRFALIDEHVWSELRQTSQPIRELS